MYFAFLIFHFLSAAVEGAEDEDAVAVVEHGVGPERWGNGEVVEGDGFAVGGYALFFHYLGQRAHLGGHYRLFVQIYCH